MQDYGAPLKDRETMGLFRKRKRRQYFISGAMIAIIIFFVTMTELGGGSNGAKPGGWPIPIVLGVAFVAGMVLTLKNWRCPSCNGYLGKGFNPRFCSKCGVRFRD